MKYMIILWLVIASTTFSQYNRKEWKHWIDADKNKLDTRQEVLIRYSFEPVTFNEKGKVEFGLWVCPYTAQVFTNASDLDIDHVVPLSYAYYAGGSNWDAQRKIDYANYLDYPYHLIPVSAYENRYKSNKTPLEYMPPNTNFHDRYTNIWYTIITNWGLSQ